MLQRSSTINNDTGSDTRVNANELGSPLKKSVFRVREIRQNGLRHFESPEKFIKYIEQVFGNLTSNVPEVALKQIKAEITEELEKKITLNGMENI